ncbi:hypothetical protein ABKV19_004856 [Rosa sericea]
MDEPSTGLDPASRHNLYGQNKEKRDHPNNHRQRIISWIDGTGQLSATFDFTTKGVLQVSSIFNRSEMFDSQLTATPTYAHIKSLS